MGFFPISLLHIFKTSFNKNISWGILLVLLGLFPINRGPEGLIKVHCSLSVFYIISLGEKVNRCASQVGLYILINFIILIYKR